MPPEMALRTALDEVDGGRRVGRAARRLGRRVGALAGAAGVRAGEVAVSTAVLLVAAPVLAVVAAAGRLRGRPWLVLRPCLGRRRSRIVLPELALGGVLRRVPHLWSVVAGDLALVGPAALTPAEAESLQPADLDRFLVRPGVVDLYRIRRAANIAFDGRTAADRELVHATGAGAALGILVRGLAAAAIGGAPAAPPRRLDLLDVAIANLTMDEAVAAVTQALDDDRPRSVCFVNPDCLNRACTDHDYREVLAASDLVLPDGIGIHYACRLLGTSLAANVNGTDLFPRLCETLGGSGHALYLLGGRPGVTNALCAHLAERWPRLRVAGHHHGYFERGGDDERALIDAIAASGASVLLVAFGAPAQEKWIAAHRDRLGVAVALGVGGLFDFYSGRVPRAPAWLRELGLEWSWRLLQEPGRLWRRYLIGNPLFLFRVWRWRRRRDAALPAWNHGTIDTTDRESGGHHVRA